MAHVLQKYPDKALLIENQQRIPQPICKQMQIIDMVKSALNSGGFQNEQNKSNKKAKQWIIARVDIG